jgi:hypothetical protein
VSQKSAPDLDGLLPAVVPDGKPDDLMVIPEFHLMDHQRNDVQAYEQRVRQEMNAQFARLKDEARAVFRAVRGRPGVRTTQQWAQMLEEAGDSLDNGRFLVQQLGAERYLDPEMVAVLITLRQNLIADLKRPTTADIMLVDSAVLAYYNMLRVQGWIGDLSLVFERELFGQASLNELHGERVGDMLREELRRLGEVLLPLQERAHKMMLRSLDRLR